MKKTNIALIGFMGAGKTGVAKLLGKRLKRDVISTDGMIEKIEGQTISDIFKTKGEAYFRALEKKVVKEISSKTGVIIDCGGGVVLDRENVVNLKAQGQLFYLFTSPQVIYQRVKHQTHRPLLQREDPLATIKELIEMRQPLYEQADVIINTDGHKLEDTCEEVLKSIGDD